MRVNGRRVFLFARIFNNITYELIKTEAPPAPTSRLSVELISYVDSDGPPGVHDGHAIALIEVLAVYVRSSKLEVSTVSMPPRPLQAVAL